MQNGLCIYSDKVMMWKIQRCFENIITLTSDFNKIKKYALLANQLLSLKTTIKLYI